MGEATTLASRSHADYSWHARLYLHRASTMVLMRRGSVAHGVAIHNISDRTYRQAVSLERYPHGLPKQGRWTHALLIGRKHVTLAANEPWYTGHAGAVGAAGAVRGQPAGLDALRRGAQAAQGAAASGGVRELRASRPGACAPVLPFSAHLSTSCPMLVITSRVRCGFPQQKGLRLFASPSVASRTALWPPQVLVENCTSAANAVLRALPMPAGASDIPLHISPLPRLLALDPPSLHRSIRLARRRNSEFSEACGHGGVMQQAARWCTCRRRTAW